MLFWKAARTSALLSGLFLLVYGGCNYLTSLRSDVGTWVYGWERLIPFVPIFIIPYMSIDLFFVAAPFLCRDEPELRIFARRITLAILIAGVFFLLFPLKYTMARPHVDGWLGVVFNQFRQMDKPYNLLPSLHITLRTILADTYHRHTRGLWRWMAGIWFSLIGFSTVLVYQHHIVDVIGGFLLAGFCFYVIRETPWYMPLTPNRKVGGYYLRGVVLLIGSAVVLRGWALWALWPAFSLLMVCLGSEYYGAGIFAKREGRLPLATRSALWPVLLGQQVSLWHYARQCRPWDALTPRVWIGRKLTDTEAHEAVRQGVTAVLDLTGEFQEAKPFLDLPYMNIAVLDLTAPTPDQIARAVAFINREAATGIVYVHCKIGYSRTAAIAGAWLLQSDIVATADQAMTRLREVRPSIVIRPEAEAAIRQFAEDRTPSEFSA